MRFHSLVFAGLALAASPEASVREFFSNFFDGVRKQYRMAKLATQEPDSVLVLPLRTTRVSRIRDTWGAARGIDRKHEGQDIFAPRGTAIHSATEGYVLRIGESRIGGKTVWVMGAGRRAYYYAHLDRHADSLDVGDWVGPEIVIGYVGTTGNAQGTPPHLHFGMYALGGAQNPLPLLRDYAPPKVEPGTTVR